MGTVPEDPEVESRWEDARELAARAVTGVRSPGEGVVRLHLLIAVIGVTLVLAPAPSIGGVAQIVGLVALLLVAMVR